MEDQEIRTPLDRRRAASDAEKRIRGWEIISLGDLSVAGHIITYDARPSSTVRIMQILDGRGAGETQNYGDPFEPGRSHAQWVGRMP